MQLPGHFPSLVGVGLGQVGGDAPRLQPHREPLVPDVEVEAEPGQEAHHPVGAQPAHRGEAEASAQQEGRAAGGEQPAVVQLPVAQRLVAGDIGLGPYDAEDPPGPFDLRLQLYSLQI